MNDSADDAGDAISDGNDAVIRANIVDKARNLHIGATWRADEHAVAAHRWRVVHTGLGTAAAVLSAAAGAAVLADAPGGWRVFAGIVTLLASVLVAVDTTLQAGKVAEEHKRGSDGFTVLRTKWLDFRYLTLPSASTTQATTIFRELVRERDDFIRQSPLPPRWARKKVHKRRNKKSPRSNKRNQ